MSKTVAGYAHPDYAASLAEFGTPRLLPECGGWILEREIQGFTDCDAMGCYPLFACQDWSRLHADLEAIEDGLISATLITDPFGAYDMSYLRRCFRDLVVPFKEHFVIDLNQSIESFVHPHHRRNARKTLQSITVETCAETACVLDEWRFLYATLIERHGITGMTTFSETSFAKQLNVPGIVVFRATHQGQCVGMNLWYIHNDVGYYHLGAYSSAGYTLRASFALFWYAIKHFAACGLCWLDLGAGAGLDASGEDGLSRFKRGWATETRTAYLCGRIFNQDKYEEIAKARGITATDYFPAYRRGEFG